MVAGRGGMVPPGLWVEGEVGAGASKTPRPSLTSAGGGIEGVGPGGDDNQGPLGGPNPRPWH